MSQLSHSGFEPNSECRELHELPSGAVALSEVGRDSAPRAIRLAAEIEAEDRPATSAKQGQQIRFTGFGERNSPMACSAGPAKTELGGLGRARLDSKKRCRIPNTLRSPAAPSMRISRRSSLFGQSGLDCCGSVDAG